MQKGNTPETRVPWEFRITKMPGVMVSTRTGNERYNYYEIDGGKLKTGFNGTAETTERDVGEVVETQPGQLLLILNSELSEGLRETVVPAIVAHLSEKGKVVQVIEGSANESEMAA